MILLDWQSIGNALLDALWWFVEGLLGTLAAATRVHTDVPWYQCLASQLIVLSIAVPIVILAERRKERKKQMERIRRGDF